MTRDKMKATPGGNGGGSGASLVRGTAGAVERVLFVRLPPFLGYGNHHPRDITLPLTIAHTATMAKRAGWTIGIFDLWAHQRTMQELLADIRAFSPDAIIFEADAPAYPTVLRCAEFVRGFSDARLMAYGSVPTFMPERVVGPALPFDAALAGESEITAIEALAAYDVGRSVAEVEGLSYWDDRQIRPVRTRPRPEIEDLDTLPPVDYSLFDLTAYRKLSFPMPLYSRVQWGHILATRGCPYPCTHCSFDHRQSFGRPFRKHSPQRVVDEMEALTRIYGVNAISFEDDIFTMERPYVLAVCDEIERRGVKAKWIVQTRVDQVDRPLLKRMKATGCVGLSFGVESGNDRVLKSLKKGFTRARALEAIRDCEAEGLMMRLLFMVGNPGETASEIEDTIDLACRAKAITIQAHISTPYPGTGLLGEDEGDSKHITDFSSYNKIVWNLSKVSDEDLWKLQGKFYSRYFFSLRYLKVFLNQRVRYLTGSWRHDLPLMFNAMKYLVGRSLGQRRRDVDSLFSGVESSAADSPEAKPGAMPEARPGDKSVADRRPAPETGTRPDLIGVEMPRPEPRERPVH